MPVGRVPTLFGLVSPLRYAVVCVQVFFAGHVFSEHVCEVTLTSGPSMLPTLHHSGDWVFINKLARRGRGVRCGDVVTVRHPMFPSERASKRIIGMPGDYVLRDDPSSGGFGGGEGRGRREKGEGEGGGGSGIGNGASSQPSMMIQVPEGHVWITGDNLPWSRDSRDYGPVPMALIRGKVVARVWPLRTAGWLRNTLEPVERG